MYTIDSRSSFEVILEKKRKPASMQSMLKNEVSESEEEVSD
jgi:hypothetical protein